MDLEEVRVWIKEDGYYVEPPLHPTNDLGVVENLNNRISELEDQIIELKAKVKSLTQMVKRREANIDENEWLARASYE